MNQVSCPRCGTLVNHDGGRFCTHCGIELHHECPGCFSELRWLATVDPQASPWCSACHSLLYACEYCGRWLLAGEHTCPDPACGARVLPTYPQHTGRRWGAQGTTVGWAWIPEWHQDHPQHRGPKADFFPANSVQAAAVAHGLALVWNGSSLLAAPRPFSQHELDQAWSTPLPQGGIPANVRLGDRIAIAGPGAVLALERGFFLVGITAQGTPHLLVPGSPLAQVANPWWWVGFSLLRDRQWLQYAPIEEQGFLDVEVVDLPPGAELSPGGSLVLHNDHVYWPARDGSVWEIKCREGSPATRIGDGEGVVVALAADADGPRAVWQLDAGLMMAHNRLSFDQPVHRVGIGKPPFQSLHVGEEHIVCLADSIAILYTETGTVHTARKPYPRVHDAALLLDNGRPLLLALASEENVAKLLVLYLGTGQEQTLWEKAGSTPLALLPTMDSLMIVLTDGLIRLGRDSNE